MKLRRKPPTETHTSNESTGQCNDPIISTPRSSTGQSSGSRIPPHQILPPELMSVIFVHLSNSYIDHRHQWDLEGLYTGSGWNRRCCALKSVCKAWAVIVLSTPKLFRCFHLTITSGIGLAGNRWLDDVFEEAQDWLTRSQQLDVDLYLHMEPPRSLFCAIELTRPLTSLLYYLLSRLRLLMYDGPSMYLPDLYAVIPYMDRLEDLRIRYHGQFEVPPLALPARLRYLTLVRCAGFLPPTYTRTPSIPAPSSAFIPHRKLTTLCLCDSPITRKILHGLPALTECVIYRSYYAQVEPHQRPEAPIIHSHLKRLELRATVGPTLSGILDDLFLPGLRHLTIQNSNIGDPNAPQISVLDQILELHRRDPFSLKSLALCQVLWHEAAFVALIRLVESSLNSLRAWNCRVNVANALLRLTLPSCPDHDHVECRPCVMMNLEELAFVEQFYNASPDVIARLIDFVNSRLWGDSSVEYRRFGRRRLKKVTLWTKGQEEIKSEKEPWEEMGCVVTSRVARMFY